MGLIENISEEVARIAAIGFADITERTAQGSDEILLRKFRSQYDKLSLEEIFAIHDMLGHKETEATPCKPCKIMAQKEYSLAED